MKNPLEKEGEIESKMLEEAQRVGVHLLDPIPGDKKKICEYLDREYGIYLPYWKSYRDLWEQNALPYYGIEVMARISLQEMRRRIPEEDYLYLKRLFQSRRTPTWDEYVQNTRFFPQEGRWAGWGWVLLRGNPETQSVSWTEYAEFFFKYAELAKPITKAEVEQIAEQRRRQLGVVSVQEERKPETIEAQAVVIEKAPQEAMVAIKAGVEDLEGLYLELLRRKGYRVERNVSIVGPYGGEIDVIGIKGDEAVLVECKHWKSQIGPVGIDRL